MEYRFFKPENKDVSLLGFGTMRLPRMESDKEKINEPLAIEMIRYAIDNGVNYIDTAYMYHGGKSEVVTGKALKDGYREKVLLADKMPVWMGNSKEEIEAIFQNQLDKLGVQCIDMYLMHNLTKAIWKRALKFETMEFLELMKAEGKIKHIGFSFHDDLDFFKTLIDAYPWEFCQIQLNYMDINFQAGLEGLKYATARNIPVVVMEPLKGGKLTDAIPTSVKDIWAASETKLTPAEWAFKWVAAQDGVFTILSGMSDMSQVKYNINIFSSGKMGLLSSAETETLEKASSEYNKLIKASCTACGYCLPCPLKIDIPTCLNYYNEWFLFDKNPKILGDFKMFTSPKARPSDCSSCRQCEEKCPQHLPISDLMRAITEEFK
ncbi:MAG: aldo/keto reductase [Eubacteriales bacterium]